MAKKIYDKPPLDPGSAWHRDIQTLFAAHPEARPTRMMGAPADWETAALWN